MSTSRSSRQRHSRSVVNSFSESDRDYEAAEKYYKSIDRALGKIEERLLNLKAFGMTKRVQKELEAVHIDLTIRMLTIVDRMDTILPTSTAKQKAAGRKHYSI